MSEQEEMPEYEEGIDRRQLFEILKRPKNLREISKLLHLDIRETYINLHKMVETGAIKAITPTETKEIFYTLPKEEGIKKVIPVE